LTGSCPISASFRQKLKEPSGFDARIWPCAYIFWNKEYVSALSVVCIINLLLESAGAEPARREDQLHSRAWRLDPSVARGFFISALGVGALQPISATDSSRIFRPGFSLLSFPVLEMHCNLDLNPCAIQIVSESYGTPRRHKPQNDKRSSVWMRAPKTNVV
jgi:hypothetical protein